MLAASLLSALLAASTAIGDARAHLANHQLDELLFDLQGQSLKGRDALEAARLLGEAAKESRADSLLSLQFAQRSIKLDAKQPLGLEFCARAALAQQQFDLAESCGDRWVRASQKSGRARLLRAEIALEEGDWKTARALAPEASQVPAEERDEAVRAKAKASAMARALVRQQADGMSMADQFDRQMERSMVRASGQPMGASGRPGAASGEVVVYGTSWCGFCAKARAWLQGRGIPFEDKDVERDHDAADELARKAREAGFTPRGVPVIDVRGTLISGFDVPRLEAALGK